MKPKSIIIQLLSIVAFVGLCLVGCSDSENPLASRFGPFNGTLIGDWVHIDEPEDGPSPVVTGIRILATREWRSLGFDSQTGFLEEGMRDCWSPVIKRACNGILTLEYPRHPFSSSTTEVDYHYEVSETELELERIGGSREIYKRSAVGTKVVEPVNAHFEVQVEGIRDGSIIDEMTFVNNGILSFPSAYAGWGPSTREGKQQLMIGAYGDHCTSTEISLIGFAGAGTYSIQYQGGSSSSGVVYDFGPCSCGCAIGENAVRTDPDINAGTVTIQEFDEVAGRCSGSFSAVLTWAHGSDSTNVVLSNGKFDVPFCP